MKSLIAFLAGCVCGSVGTLLYLRRDIKKQLEEIQNEAISKDNEDSDEKDKSEKELPFTIGEGGEVDEVRGPINKNDDTRIRMESSKVNTVKTKYDSLVRGYTEPSTGEFLTDEEKDEADLAEIKTRPQFEPIHDMTEFNDPLFDTETYIFFRGDNIFCTDQGVVVERPALLVGTEWTKWIGTVKPNTALVRDNKRLKSIDICIDDGLYSDEYGDYIKED